jgi:hypothetical protein
MEEIINNLEWLSIYAASIRVQLQQKETPSQYELNRVRDLAEKVQRHFDPQLEEIGNGSA